MPEQTATDKLLGFTQVWVGKPTEFIQVIKQWATVKEDYLQLHSTEQLTDITLWVANEWIDWANYRAMKTFRPANSANTINDRVYDEFMEAQALSKMEKAEEEKWQKRTPLSKRYTLLDSGMRTIEDYYNK